jgi:hypothetical protein
MPLLLSFQQYQEVLLILLEILINSFSGKNLYINQHFLPFGRATLAASASLQPIRGSSLQPGSGFILMMKKGTLFAFGHLFTTKPDPNFLTARAILTRE